VRGHAVAGEVDPEAGVVVDRVARNGNRSALLDVDADAVVLGDLVAVTGGRVTDDRPDGPLLAHEDSAATVVQDFVSPDSDPAEALDVDSVPTVRRDEVARSRPTDQNRAGRHLAHEDSGYVRYRDRA